MHILQFSSVFYYHIRKKTDQANETMNKMKTSSKQQEVMNNLGSFLIKQQFSLNVFKNIQYTKGALLPDREGQSAKEKSHESLHSIMT